MKSGSMVILPQIVKREPKDPKDKGRYVMSKET